MECGRLTRLVIPALKTGSLKDSSNDQFSGPSGQNLVFSDFLKYTVYYIYSTTYPRKLIPPDYSFSSSTNPLHSKSNIHIFLIAEPKKIMKDILQAISNFAFPSAPSRERTLQWVRSQNDIDPRSRPPAGTNQAEPWEQQRRGSSNSESRRRSYGPRDRANLHLEFLLSEPFRNGGRTPVTEVNEEGRVLDNSVCYDRDCRICDPAPPLQVGHSLLVNGIGGFGRGYMADNEFGSGVTLVENDWYEDDWSTTTDEEEERRKEETDQTVPPRNENRRGSRSRHHRQRFSSGWNRVRNCLRHSSTRRISRLFPDKSTP